MFLPLKVVPRIIMNKNNLWMEVVCRMIPYAIELKIIVRINIGRLP